MSNREPRANPETAGVYAELDELVRLQFKAQGFTFLPRQPVHSILAGRHASRLRGRGLNFEEIRSYLPGDDIRNMDWKVTARLREPHVRVYTEEKDRPTLLVVDQRMSMFFGSRRTMKSVVAAEAAALAAWRILGAGDRVGAIVFSDSEVTEIAPHRSEARVMQILRTIVEKNHSLGAMQAGSMKAAPAARPEKLNEAFRSATRVATHNYLVCLISDGYGSDEETVRLVTELSAHNDVITLFIYDPLESELPDAGKVVVSESDLQLEVDTSKSKVREQFNNQFLKRMEKMQDLSRLRSIPLLPIRTDAGVAEQVRSLLGHAPAIRSKV